MLGSSVLLARLAGLGVVLAGVFGCSLNYQSAYEADVRFEHCYRIDEERHASMAEKVRCWREWSQKYTYGQTRDRVEYALARQRTLEQALASGERTAPPGAGGLTRYASPQPTNAFVPPPQILARDAGGAAVIAPAARFLEAPAAYAAAPGASCIEACGRLWVVCGDQCKGNGCQSSCDDSYRVCMRACY